MLCKSRDSKTYRRLHPERKMLWEKGVDRNVLSGTFRDAMLKFDDLRVIGRLSKRGRKHSNYRIHLYSLRKYFFSQVTSEVGDAIAHSWCGRKGYLSNYLRLPIEERRKLYLKCMPRLTIFSDEPPKTEDRLRERLKTRGLSDEDINKALEGLDLA